MVNSIELNPIRITSFERNEKGKFIYEKYLKDLDYKNIFFHHLRSQTFDKNYVDEYERQTAYIIIEMFYELVRNRHFDVANSILAKWNIKENHTD